MLSKILPLLLSLNAHAESNDTYNFYFQKAPGPVRVNQGASSASAQQPDVKVKGDGSAVVVTTPPAAASSVAAAPAPEEAFAGLRRWELAFGVSGTRVNGNGTDSMGYYYNPPVQSGMINAGQFYLAVQYNLNEVFGLQAEGYRLAKAPDDRGLPVSGSLFDYGASLVVTPFRWKAGEKVKITAALLVGATSVPIAKNFSAAHVPSGNAQVTHAGSAVYGARVAVELSDRLAVQASARKIDRFASTQGVLSLGLLL